MAGSEQCESEPEQQRKRRGRRENDTGRRGARAVKRAEKANREDAEDAAGAEGELSEEAGRVRGHGETERERYILRERERGGERPAARAPDGTSRKNDLLA